MFDYERLKVTVPPVKEIEDSFDNDGNRFICFCTKNTVVITNHANYDGIFNDEKNFFKIFHEYKKTHNVRIFCCHPAKVVEKHPELRKHVFFPDYNYNLIGWYKNKYLTIFKVSSELWDELPEDMQENMWKIVCNG